MRRAARAALLPLLALLAGVAVGVSRADIDGARRGHGCGEGRMSSQAPITATDTRKDLPLLATVDETAALLRTSRKAIYSMIERGQLPGVTRIGRRNRTNRVSHRDTICDGTSSPDDQRKQDL